MKPRLRPIVLAATLLLAACGTSSPSGSESAGETVTVTAANGTIAVPVTERGLWALDAFTALNLMTVGVVPEHAASTHEGQDAREEILVDAGVEIVEAHKPEMVAGAEPSLIVGIDHPEHRSLLDQLETIAPVVLIEDGNGADAQMEIIGTTTGHSAEAADVVDRIDAAISELAARIDDAGCAGQTVSILQEYPTVFYAYDRSTQFSALLTRLGLDRPEPQSGESEWGFIEVSEENLSDHMADIVIALVDDIFSQGQSVLDSPMLDTSDAITADVEFSGWYNNDILSVWWVLHDVEAILIEQAQPATFADVPALWAWALESLTSSVG